jgi:hypothetical protein
MYFKACFHCHFLSTKNIRLYYVQGGVGIAPGYGLGGSGLIPGRDTESRPAMGPAEPPTQWIRGTLSPRAKRPGCEADHSPPSTAAVKNGEAIPPLPHISSWHSA